MGEEQKKDDRQNTPLWPLFSNNVVVHANVLLGSDSPHMILAVLESIEKESCD